MSSRLKTNKRPSVSLSLSNIKACIKRWPTIKMGLRSFLIVINPQAYTWSMVTSFSDGSNFLQRRTPKLNRLFRKASIKLVPTKRSKKHQKVLYLHRRPKSRLKKGSALMNLATRLQAEYKSECRVRNQILRLAIKNWRAWLVTAHLAQNMTRNLANPNPHPFLARWS